MNDLQTISRTVLAPDFTVATGIEQFKPDEIAQAIAELENPASLAKLEPKLDGAMSKSLLDHLRPIGAKIAPLLNDDQALSWRSAVVLALSDLPPRIALYATRKAIHVPMVHLNRVDGVIRELGAEAIEKQKVALHRLKMMQAEIERAAKPATPQLEQQPMRWTQADVDEANASFHRLRIKTRYVLDGEDVKVIEAEHGLREIDAPEN